MLSYWPTEARKTLIEYIQTNLIDGVADDDPSLVSVVSYGKYLGDPARAGVVVEVYENDPENAEWYHTIRVRGDDDPKVRGDLVGRRRNWWLRRFTIRVVIFKRGITQIDADEIRGSILSRIEDILLSYPSLGSLNDDGGERAILGRIVRENGTQGGDNLNPVWIYKIWLEFETERRA